MVEYDKESGDTIATEKDASTPPHAPIFPRIRLGSRRIKRSKPSQSNAQPAALFKNREQAPPAQEQTSHRDGFLMRFWQFVRHWLINSTFTPVWLPRKMRYSIVGYLLAIFLEVIAVLTSLSLTQLFPSFTFTGLLEILAVALIALSWGAGPSMTATIVGAALLDFFILPPHLSWGLSGVGKFIEIFLFLLVGLIISIVASQVERTHRQTEELATSLAAERARLDAIIETVPDAVSIHDAQGAVVRLNRVGRENAGPHRGNETLVDSQEAYGVRTVDDKPFPLEDFPVARALRGETVSSVELRYFDAEHKDRYILASAAPLRSPEGDIDGVVLITHDITALRQSQRELVSRASQLEAIFEAMADGIFVYSSDGSLVHTNLAARELFALDRQPNYTSLPIYERVPQTVIRNEQGQFLPPDQWPMLRILRGEMLKGPKTMDVMIQALDGRDVQLGVSGAPMRDPEGNIVGGVLIVRDETEHRHLERRTHEALNALLAMAEALVLMPEGAKPTGKLPPKGANKVARRLAELTRSVLGCGRVGISAIEPDTDILRTVAVVGLSPEQEQEWWANQSEETHLSDSSDPELVARLRANEVVILDMTQPPYKDLPNPYGARIILVAPMCIGDQLVGILSLDHDGADHEYTQEEIALASAVAKLAAFVFERDRLLRERAEARATELALREANRRMNEFLGMTSHELKTPLTSIKGNTQLAVRQLKSSLHALETMQHLIENSDSQIKRLNRLVDDLLDISRTQVGHLELSLAQCNLATILSEAVQVQRRAWPIRTITLDLSNETIAPVNADADRITQVITNYLTNALKYSAEDRPVQVSLKQQGKDVRVSVRDEGLGLSPEEQKLIWERFHRVHNVPVQSSSYDSGAGLGLGLYISKMLIEQHHGHVGVESTPNVGSTFWFTLPLAQQ